ncbi:fatty acid/phospholipid synthesis protein PlsX [Roseibium sp. TrichSKD4]|uniref:phosphate acyltransferase PlsX n=1 Tax=Roseibium sp. TrichSKD4 TaxID=744980 RepID=UPI0001E56ED5|nr:phosphate acyltransferase PlsX [Roseibium sp. TrichSKD4]EFO30352.1 fatty acid/phospholipid synthesis protein PlsX [Roseibium sp. TrichSKD4]
MAKTIPISLDVMGGDHGAEVVLPGAEIALVRHLDIRYLLYGKEDVVLPLLEKYPRVKAASTFHHCDVSIAMDTKPSQALRQGRWRSSMWRSIEAVKTGEAAVAVSAGNTGALMAMSKFCLRTMANIERPAIAAIWPTSRGESVVLDVGATIGADAQQLIDFAILGGAMARALFGIKKPTVGLLNIGVEEVKGLEEVRTAGRLLRERQLRSLSYAGFVEGDDLGKGTVDVVVTEGFAGNIALKTAEGTAKQIGGYLRSAMQRTLMSKIGYIFAKDAFNRLREKMDPRKVNGGVFLGLNGIVIKSHGGTDAEGYASAIDLAYDMVRNELTDKIAHDLVHYHRSAFADDMEKSEGDL